MAPLPTRLRRRLVCCLPLVAVLLAPALAADDAKGVAFFETKIRPVLVEKCHECHSSQAKKPKGGLKVDSRAAIRAGGTSGPAVVPGDLDASLLYQAISAADGVEPMPPKAKLPASVVADFRQWITIGAPDPREGTKDEAGTPARPPRAAIGGRSSRSRDASVPPVDPAMAHWVRNPIDAFVLARLEEKHLRARPRGRPPHLDPPALV